MFLYMKAYAPWSWVILAGGVIVGSWLIGYGLLAWLDARRHRKFLKKWAAKP